MRMQLHADFFLANNFNNFSIFNEFFDILEIVFANGRKHPYQTGAS
jgi:hypothetical protein